MTLVDDAVRAARQAARTADVTLRDADGLTTSALAELARTFDRVWGRDVDAMGSIVSGEILWATSHAGAQVTAAYDGEQLVGGTATFLGRDRDGLHLHSHLTGVLPGHAGRGVGLALKLHQRAWCLQRDIRRVVWTYDPLVRRNAVLNLVALGARPVEYFRDLYGPMADERNAGLPTDRLLVHWDLDDPRVVNAAAGRRAEPRVDALRRGGAVPVLTEDADGAPHLAVEHLAPRMLVQVPTDIEALRRDRPEIARRWLEGIRATLAAAIDAGYRVTGITRDGWYVVTADRDVAELA